MPLNKSFYSSKKHNWGTPQSLFDKLNKEFNFTLDVCAATKNAKCKQYYTELDNGLIQEWIGRAWMNPPFGKEISAWVEKAYKSSILCVCLLPVRSDTKWWHKYVMKADEIRFLTKRLSFEGASNSAPFTTSIVVFDKRLNISPIIRSYDP